MREFVTIVWIGCGGACGAVLRYLVISRTQQLSNTTFPLGTLIVNVVGSLFLGMVMALPESRISADLKRAIAIGVLGALTTFSTFALDTLLQAEQRVSAGFLNIALNVSLALAAVYAGRGLVRWFL